MKGIEMYYEDYPDATPGINGTVPFNKIPDVAGGLFWELLLK